ncbi:MAG: caspase family protein [Hyphomicrobiaceae bacterium]
MSFVYYSGHGIANPDTRANYLVPVDVKKADADLWYNAVEQRTIIDKLKTEAPRATHYIVFDACRNELNVTEDVSSTFKALGDAKGFQPVSDTTGMLIAYATAPGKTASDRGDGIGPYAKVLAEEIGRPGVEAVAMFRTVHLKVKQAIGQDPWLSIPSLPEVYFAGRAEAPPPAPSPSAPVPVSRAEVADICGKIATNPSAAIVESLRDAYKGTPMAGCGRRGLPNSSACR